MEENNDKVSKKVNLKKVSNELEKDKKNNNKLNDKKFFSNNKEKKVSKIKKETLQDESKVQKYKLEKKKNSFLKDIYIKLNEIVKKIALKVKEKNSIKLFIVGIVAIIILIFLIIFIKDLMFKMFIGKYKDYETKMQTYGFTKIYNNGSTDSFEKITKIEALKLAIAAMKNVTDLSGIATTYVDYPDQTWIEYAYYFDIASEEDINRDNKDEEVEYWEIVKYFENAKIAFTKEENKGSNKVVVSNAAKYSTEIQTSFSDLVESNIIKIKTSNINAEEKVLKAFANELAVNSLEYYSTLSEQKERLRMTDKPNNEENYPYLLFDIDPKIYLYNFEKADSNNFKSPKQLYSDYKNYSLFIKTNLEGFYYTILNVDYENIDSNAIYTELNNYSLGTIKLKEIKEYVDYVKTNKIKIKSDIKYIEPCLYFDGENFRARLKIDIKILNSDNKQNVIFNDSNYGNIIYDQNEFTIYIDAKIKFIIDSSEMYIYFEDGLVSRALNINDFKITIQKNVNK